MQRTGVTLGLIVFGLSGMIEGTTVFAGPSPMDASAIRACEFNEIKIGPSKDGGYGLAPFQNPPDLRSKDGVLDAELIAQYSDASTSIAGCPVRLRTYNGQLVGPTLRIRQGDVVNLLLSNNLPQETADEVQAQFLQESSSAYLGTTPASFNTTNVHFHGLHVSPTGNSDNVLLDIAPQSHLRYEVKVPATHPIGSYWYHAHAHGSTAIQVGSGMAGAIIIEDDPNKIPPKLLAANAREKVFVLQTILYNEQGKLDRIATLFPSPTTPSPTNCDKASGNYGTWSCAKRRITINGQLVPVITMKPGEVQRWRLIDTAFREGIAFAVQGHDLHEIALDGNYLGRVDTWKAGTPIDLQPGYRSDILIKASLKPGEYHILDLPATKDKSLRAADEPQNLLAILKVTGEPHDMLLPTNEEMAPLAPFGNLDLTKQALGVQEVIFKLGQDMAGSNKNYFQVNYRAFSPDHVRQLPLDAVQMWALTTVNDPPNVPEGIGQPDPWLTPPPPHVFHIHVNPFQWLRQAPDGRPELVWKDTLLVQGPKVTNVYTRYQDYIGKFVMHCHILDHEDLGMMEVEQVVNSVNGIASPHAH